MFTAVTEAARVINPLSLAISKVLAKIYIGLYEYISFIVRQRKLVLQEKNIKELAYALKTEYPHESQDYVEYLARTSFKDAI